LGAARAQGAGKEVETKLDSMYLLNCRACDDVVKLVEKERSCECGRSKGVSTPLLTATTGPARTLVISWEAYDGITEGESRPFTVLPRVQTRRQP
jgi:hypothetical protein